MDRSELEAWLEVKRGWSATRSNLRWRAAKHELGREAFYLTAQIMSGAITALEKAILEASAKED